MSKFRQVADEMKKLPAPGATTEEQASALLVDRPVEHLPPRRRSAALVKYDPDRATEIIRQWLRDEV
ncbi:MAG: hypothetical protein M1398_00290 [Deltaproteobacteria bacterium]|nr:hypothetical protein [Deltaproteobacteria bacterium]